MVDFKYLYTGLCGLARAHQANGMAGHLGAAVVAGYFIGEDQPDLSQPVVKAIEHELDQIIEGDESIWFDPEKTGVTISQMFEPVDVTDPDAGRVAALPEALSVNIDRLRQSGHNVIFSSIAIRALRDHPQYASSAMVDGIVKLIQRFDQAGPGRGYYGKERGWVIGEIEDLPPDDLPMYADETSMAHAVINELISSASIRRQGYGSLFHIINHANAIVELSRFGYKDLAKRDLDVHHHHLRMWRALPDVSDELGSLVAAEHDPRTAEYWQETDSTQWSAHLTHRIKTIYGFYNLLRLIDDAETRSKAEQGFLYLMG